MSKRNGSSIRKKIVRGYIRIYCFISFILFFLFVAGAYVTAFYAAQEYMRADIETSLREIAELRQEGQGAQALYEEAEKIMPGYILRYDIIETESKVKEEHYYDRNYYRGDSSGMDEPMATIQATPTPRPATASDQPTEELLDYDTDDLEKGYVTSGTLNLRQYPSIDSVIFFNVEYGTEIPIIEDLGEWYKVLYEGRELYATSRLISLGAQPTPTPPIYDEFWQAQSQHLFSKKGPEYTTESAFDWNQTGNAAVSLKEPYLLYISTGFPVYEELEGKDYVQEKYYSIKAVADINELIQGNVIWSAVSIILAGIFILFFAGLLLIWIYGAAKTKRYLKPIDEITRLANEIQPNSPYRLNVDTAKYELKELVITINNMLDRLNAAHVKRRKFVSDVSHELRTPISVIAGYANMLKRWARDDEAVFDESVDAIIDESSNMKYLVENLLFLARSDNDQNVYEMEPFDISNLIESICRDAKMVDKEKHEIICDIEQGVIVNGDRNRLKQAIREFMQNAMKYTPPTGEIKLTLQKDMALRAIINIRRHRYRNI